MNILIIDGQGGRVGRQLVEAVRQNLPAARVTAVGQSPAKKLLIPFNQCSARIVGTPELTMSQLLDAAVEEIRRAEAEL